MKNRKKVVRITCLVIFLVVIAAYNYYNVTIPKIYEDMILDLEYPIGTKMILPKNIKLKTFEVLSELKCFRTEDYSSMVSANTISLRIYSYEMNKSWPVQVYLLVDRPQSSFYAYKGVVGTLPLEVSEKLIQVIKLNATTINN